MNINSSESNDSALTYLDFIKIFLKYKKLILIVTLLAGAITAILVFFVIPPTFLSTSTVKSFGGSGTSALMSLSGVPDLGGLEELSGGGSVKELATYEEILLSRRCLEETIIKFNLMDVYDFKYMQDALKAFREELMELSVNKKAGTLTIGIYDKDKVRARDIVDFLISQLNKIYSEMKVQNAKNNREFLEGRYESIKNALTLKEDSLKNFQDQNGIAPDIQIQAALKVSYELESELKAEEVKLDLLKKIISPDQPEIKTQEEKIRSIRKKIEEMQNEDYQKNNLNLKNAPDRVMNFIRLKRDVEIQNKILTTVIPLLEQAKVEEQKQTPTVIVLDKPDIPDLKKKPKRLTLTFLSIVLGFVLTYSYALFYEIYWKKIIREIKTFNA